MKIRIVIFIKQFWFSVRNIRQAYYRIQTDGRTDLNFNSEPVSPVSHSVKFSWFLSESIIFKVEIEDRNLVLALLQKIPGSAGKNIDFRFNYTPECMVSSMHFQQFSEVRLAQPLPRLLPAQSRAAPSIRASPSILGRFTPSIDSGFALNSPPQTCMCINPFPNRRELDQTLFPNPNFLSSPTLNPKYHSKST